MYYSLGDEHILQVSSKYYSNNGDITKCQFLRNDDAGQRQRQGYSNTTGFSLKTAKLKRCVCKHISTY